MRRPDTGDAGLLLDRYNEGLKLMRLIAKVAAAAVLPILFAAPALADEQHDKLLAMCSEGEPDPSSCECQVTAMEANVDAKVIKVIIAMQEATKAEPPVDPAKANEDALKDAGLTQDEFNKLMEEGMTKSQGPMDACKKK